MKTPIKRLLSLLVAVLLISICLGQAPGFKYLGNDGTTRFFEIYDNEGKPVKQASEMGVNGNPMLTLHWGRGIIQYKNGKGYDDSSMNYSLADHKIYYTRPEKVFLVLLPVKSLFLRIPEEAADSVTYLFKSGYPAIENLDSNSLYQVLYEGENIQLLLWEHKKVREVQNYGESREKEFVLVKQLYVYYPREQKISPLNNSLTGIEKSLPNYRQTIQDYLGSHKFNAKDSRQLTDLVAYLDKHDRTLH
ncbi:MAG: hypothetical protein RLZZ28_165 [Bacteroidota bacterium]